MDHTPIRRTLTRAWIPEKRELGHLILPEDPRYYDSYGPQLEEEKQQITKRLFGLLQSDILRVSPHKMPAKLPEHLPRDILRTWFRNVIPGLQDWLIDYVDRASHDWCHHDPEMGYLVAKLLFVRFRSSLLREWRVCGEPRYEGGKADVGLINPKGECIIAVEIGDTKPKKFWEGFFYRKFMQLWYFPPHFPRKGVGPRLFNNLQFYQYKWQRQEVYFVWTRGLRWGEKYPYIDRPDIGR